MDDFLSQRRVDKKNDKIPTFTGMGPAKQGKWCVSDSEYEDFLDKLHDHIFVQKKQPFGFIERPRGDGVIPLLIDLDFHFESNTTLGHKFDHDQIRSFIEAYFKVLNTYFDIGDKKAPKFYVTLRPQAYKDSKKNIVKDGIHIECRDITLLDKHQLFIRGKLMDDGIIENTFSNMGYTNKEADIYDEKIYRNCGWFFYGESKPTTGAYKLELVYKYDMKKERWIQESKDLYPSNRELMQLLSIRYKLAEPNKARAAHANTIEEWCADQGRPAEQELSPSNEMMKEVKEIAKEATYLFDNYISKEQHEFISALVLECLSDERADDFMGWMRVGWCLRNIECSDAMFNLWMDFSRKSAKFREGEVGKHYRDWNSNTMGRIEGTPQLRLGSLHKWAREDNPTRYKELIENDIHIKIQQIARVAKGGTHHHLAQVVYMMFSDRFKCHVENKNTEWYEFSMNTWLPVPQAIKIKQKLSYEVAVQVGKARSKVIYPGDEEREMKEKSLLLDLERNLYNANFKDNVIKECVQLFMDEDFHKKMNADPYKIGCANGILHLRAHEVRDAADRLIGYKSELRPGTPDDYVSFQVGVCSMNNVSLEAFDYEPYDPDNPDVAELMHFFSLIFPDPELREFVLTLAAGCLEGDNMEQSFYIMTGSGSNGKSKFVNLMKFTLGDYASSLSTTTITRKRPDAGAANPDLITIKNRRFIDMAEPDEREQLNTAIIKQLSGGDTLLARGLFKDQEQIRVSGKIFLATNRMPKIESMDGGTWRRLKVIPFMAKFLDPGHPQIDPANNYHEKDYGLDEKLRRWRVAFFSLLVHYYETKYCPTGIRKIPSMVDEYTNEYKTSYDSFQKFLIERIRVASAKDQSAVGESATIKQIYACFKNWAASNDEKPISEKEMKARLDELYGRPADNKTYMNMILYEDDGHME